MHYFIKFLHLGPIASHWLNQTHTVCDRNVAQRIYFSAIYGVIFSEMTEKECVKERNPALKKHMSHVHYMCGCFTVQQLTASSSALDANVNNNADSSEHFEPDSHVELPPEVSHLSLSPSLLPLCMCVCDVRLFSCFIGCFIVASSLLIYTSCISYCSLRPRCSAVFLQLHTVMILITILIARTCHRCYPWSMVHRVLKTHIGSQINASLLLLMCGPLCI